MALFQNLWVAHPGNSFRHIWVFQIVDGKTIHPSIKLLVLNSHVCMSLDCGRNRSTRGKLKPKRGEHALHIERPCGSIRSSKTRYYNFTKSGADPCKTRSYDARVLSGHRVVAVWFSEWFLTCYKVVTNWSKSEDFTQVFGMFIIIYLVNTLVNMMFIFTLEPYSDRISLKRVDGVM